MPYSNDIQIIATGLTTLHEARYFAAMGADWLGFNMTHLTADDLQTIAAWVVGPQMYVEVQNVQEDLLFEIANKIHLHGVCVQPNTSGLPDWYDGKIIRYFQFPFQEDALVAPGRDTLLLKLNSFPRKMEIIEALSNICQKYPCWVEYDLTQNSPAELCELVPVNGIVLRCVERTGRTEDIYEQYDLFFDQMGEIREAHS